MNWLDSLMDAANAADVGKEVEVKSLLMPEYLYYWERYVENSHWDDGKPMWMHYVPPMITSHMRLQNLSASYSPKDILMYLSGQQLLSLNVYEAYLIQGLHMAYDRVSPDDRDDENVCIALCGDIYNKIYFTKYWGDGSSVVQRLVDLLKKLNDKSIDKKDILRLCLSKKGVPSLFEVGGLHVGLVLANLLLWKYSILSSSDSTCYVLLLPGNEIDAAVQRILNDDGSLIEDDAFWDNFTNLVISEVEIIK